jgi:hypothetical protein
MEAFNELQRLSGSPECAARYLETVADLDVRELLSQVRAPTLVMHFRDDTASQAYISMDGEPFSSLSWMYGASGSKDTPPNHKAD